MAGVVNWLDVDGNWGNVANWDTGAVPGAGDTARVSIGNKTITSGLTQAASLSKLEIGDRFVGSLGTAGSPLAYTSGITTVEINCPRASLLHVNPYGCTDFKVRDAPSGLLGLMVTGSGTVASLHVAKAGMLQLLAGTFTNINIGGSDMPPNISVVEGVTITNLTMVNGVVSSGVGVGTLLRIIGGVFKHDSLTAGTIGEVNIFPGGVLEWNCKGGTITTAKVFGGLLDASQSPFARTFAATAAEVWRGGVINLNNGNSNITVSNNIKRYGGKVMGTTSITEYLFEVPEA
jgi:hypothetical protein